MKRNKKIKVKLNTPFKRWFVKYKEYNEVELFNCNTLEEAKAEARGKLGLRALRDLNNTIKLYIK